MIIDNYMCVCVYIYIIISYIPYNYNSDVSISTEVIIASYVLYRDVAIYIVSYNMLVFIKYIDHFVNLKKENIRMDHKKYLNKMNLVIPLYLILILTVALLAS